MAITSYGIAADQVAMLTKQPIPGNLYYEIALRQEQVTKVAEPILYSTSHLQETEMLFYGAEREQDSTDDDESDSFKATLLEVFSNLK